MRNRPVPLQTSVALLIAGALLTGISVVAAGAAATWGAPTTIRGLPQTARAFGGRLSQLSCSSTKNCTTVGSFSNQAGHDQLFSSTETHGVWGIAKGLGGPGTAGMVSTLSCTSAGNCVLGGSVFLSNHTYDGFVARQTNGLWGATILVSDPGAVAVGLGLAYGVNQVACAGSTCAIVGNDSAGGYAFTLAGSTWTALQRLPDVLGTDPGTVTSASLVSCPTSGNCTIAGPYSVTTTQSVGAFTMDEHNGVWGNPTELSGLTVLNSSSSASAAVTTLSCGAPGSCVVGGKYQFDHTAMWYYVESYFASEVHGVWSGATEVPGTARLNVHGVGFVTDSSCTQDGSCTLIGEFSDVKSLSHAYVLHETNGVWGSARRMPSVAGITGFYFSHVSCVSVTRCVAVGSIGEQYGVRAVETGGVWSAAAAYGLAAPNHVYYGNQLNAVSCTTRGYCVLGGTYRTSVENMTGSRPVPARTSVYVESTQI